MQYNQINYFGKTNTKGRMDIFIGVKRKNEGLSVSFGINNGISNRGIERLTETFDNRKKKVFFSSHL